MAANDAPETPEALRESLVELRVEHRDLDEAIERLTATPPDDDLLVRRLKKRKLMIKDRMSALERLIDPDEYA